MTGISANATHALWGYSGGALASEWAVELRPQYAPELKFVGAALGGLTINVTNVVLYANKGGFSWLNFASINGLAHAYPDARAYIDKDLVQEKVDQFHLFISSAPTIQNQRRDSPLRILHSISRTGLTFSKTR